MWYAVIAMSIMATGYLAGYTDHGVSSSTVGSRARVIRVRAVGSDNSKKKRMTVLHANGTEIVVAEEATHKNPYPLSDKLSVVVENGFYTITLPVGYEAAHHPEVRIRPLYSGKQKDPRSIIIDTPYKTLAMIRVQDPNDHLIVTIDRDNSALLAPAVGEYISRKANRLEVVIAEGAAANDMAHGG